MIEPVSGGMGVSAMIDVTVIVVPPLLSDADSVVTAWVLHGASTEVADENETVGSSTARED